MLRDPWQRASCALPLEEERPAFSKGGRILDVNMRLKNYSHTYPDDVDLLLVHGTRNLIVMSDSGVNNTTLDDKVTNGFLPGCVINW